MASDSLAGHSVTLRSVQVVTDDLAIPQEKMEDCLVVVYTRSGADLGRRVPCRHGLTIGRDSSSELVLDSERLSRRHCELRGYGTGWIVRDLSSTNGTFINGNRITEAILSPGDMLEVGGAILRFLGGADVEDQYRDTVYRMTLEDGLTGLANRRHLLEVLQREIDRAKRYGRPLGMALVDLDQFRRLGERYGFLAADHLLKDLSRALKDSLRKEDFLGRYGVDVFLAIYPETQGEGLMRAAEQLREKVRATVTEIDGVVLRVTASVGVTTYQHAWDLPGFLESADLAVIEAKAEGGNRSCMATAQQDDGADAPDRPSVRFSRMLEPERFKYRTLAEDNPGPLMALEIADEATVVQALGAEAVDTWFDELEKDLLAVSNPEDRVTRWHPRCLMLGLDHEHTGQTEEMLRRQLEERFCSRPLPEVRPGTVVRGVRAASVGAAEILRHGERVFDLLADQLLADRAGVITNDIWDNLPFTLAAPLALASGRPTPLGRLRLLQRGVDSTLRFLVATSVGLLREIGWNATDLGEVLSGFTGRPLSTADWEEAAFRLATHVPDDRTDPIGQAARCLVIGNGRSVLAERLRGLMPLKLPDSRLREGGETRSIAETHEEEERRLREIMQKLAVTLRPLSKLRMVSVAGIEQVDRSDPITYLLRLHRGPQEYFPLVCEEVAGRLSRDGCYLLREPGSPPLKLSPLIFAEPCELCCRTEVFLAETLDLDARGGHRPGMADGVHDSSPVRGFGLITMHPGVYRPASPAAAGAARSQTLSGLRNLAGSPGMR
jgi:diguanylate cyclase (GGDEF)-like protein